MSLFVRRHRPAAYLWYGMLAKNAWNSSRRPSQSTASSSPRQAHAVRRLLRRVLHQVAQQVLVQALPNLPVRIAQPIQRHAAQRLLPRDGQVAGLEQQRLRADTAHVERRQQLRRAHHLIQRHRGHAPLEQRVHQERRRPRLEPVRGELAAVEQQQQVVRVVHLLRPAPAIAVVPLSHPLPVQADRPAPARSRTGDSRRPRLRCRPTAPSRWYPGIPAP